MAALSPTLISTKINGSDYEKLLCKYLWRFFHQMYFEKRVCSFTYAHISSSYSNYCSLDILRTDCIHLIFNEKYYSVNIGTSWFILLSAISVFPVVERRRLYSLSPLRLQFGSNSPVADFWLSPQRKIHILLNIFVPFRSSKFVDGASVIVQNLFKNGLTSVLEKLSEVLVSYRILIDFRSCQVLLTSSISWAGRLSWRLC